MASPLAQFRAGLLVKDGTTLKPDARKGLIRVIRDAEDLLHFQWAERTAAGALVGEPQIDQVVFPGEASFEKVSAPSAPSTDASCSPHTRTGPSSWNARAPGCSL